MEIADNPQLKLAFDFVQYTNRNIFLTGKAGTGKTTFLHRLKQRSPKRMIVVAPTGVAAINAGGVTIHSFFQMPFGPHIPQNDPFSKKEEPKTFTQRFNREKIDIIRTLDLLVIDEISMVRADLLDGIDEVLRRFREHDLPFGGVQLLMIGDLQQLPPVIKDEEWNLLKNYYESAFFFSSLALKRTDHVCIELKHIYRQRDQAFINILNKIRENNLDPEAITELNKRFIPDFFQKHSDGYITLTTHNHQAQQLNEKKLRDLNSKAHIYEAVVSGDFPEYSYPTDFSLVLKEGAQVMFVKNDTSREKLYYNGKIGKIVNIDEEVIYVRCEGEEIDIEVGMVEWQNNKYTLNELTKEIEESVAGTFTQYPLKLAWAITIHKSQGLTFERAIIDANAAFAHGQVYVALSRCKTLEGMVLSSRIGSNCIKNDFAVSSFIREAEKNSPGEKQLNEAKIAYQRMLVKDLFVFSGIQRRLSYCLKIMKDNQTSFHNYLSDAFLRMNDFLKTEIIAVAGKFESQELQKLFNQSTDLEQDEFLQSRIRKACTYFLGKIETGISQLLNDLTIDVDNKAIRKTFLETVSKLREETAVKQSCLKACTQGFSVKTCLEAKATASILETKTKTKKEEKVVSGTIPHPELYSRLRQWRESRADELNVPIYFVFPQKVLMSLVEQLPVNLNELSKLGGFGKKKLKTFGPGIIEIVTGYCSEKGIKSEVEDRIDLIVPDKIPKTNSKKITLDLFLLGKSVEKIAIERGMALTTIEGHLAQFISNGELDITKIVDYEKIKRISDYFISSQSQLLTPAKEALGNEVSYAELRYVLNHLRFLKKV